MASQLILGKKSIAYASKVGGGIINGVNEIDKLDVGSIAIFTENNKLVTAATTTASIASVKQFYIASGEVDSDGVNITKVTVPIDRQAFHRSYCAYIPPKKHVVRVGNDGNVGNLNLPAILEAGMVASLKVGIEYDDSAHVITYEIYDYVVRPGDTELEVAQGIVDAINRANAVSVHTRWSALLINGAAPYGIELQSEVFNDKMIVVKNEILEYADVIDATPITYGKGTPAEIKIFEKLTFSYEGDTSGQANGDIYFKAPSQVDMSAKYDTYNISWSTETRTSGSLIIRGQNHVLVAIPDGSLRATFDTILRNIILQSPTGGSGSSHATL